MIDEALKYRIEFGLSVFPIVENSKRPAFEWQRFQFLRANYEEIVKWDNRMNLAMATGSLSGIVVVDCESEADANWFAHQRCDSPVKVKTPRGFHLWFRHPGFHVSNATKVKDENGQPRYDIRGDGGYVLVPNSRVVANGKDVRVSGRYQWWSDLTSLKKIPLFNSTWSRGDQSTIQRPIRNGPEYIKHIFAISGVGGHNETYRATCKLKESGLNSTEAFAVLIEWNETNAKPKWSLKELQHKIESVYGKD